jgi:hypothetical protein
MSGYLPPGTLKALDSVRHALYRVGLKEPWLWTGSYTNPDFFHYLPTGRDYRKFAPG